MEIHWVTEQSPIGCNELQLLTMTEEMVVCTCVCVRCVDIRVGTDTS